MAGNRQAGAARLADISSHQIQVIDPHHAIGTVGALVDAHRPDAHRPVGFGIQPRYRADGIFVYTAQFGGSGRVIVLDFFCQLVKTIGVGIDIVAVFQSFFENDMDQSILQYDIRTRRDGQMDVGILCKDGHTRVNDDQRKTALFLRFFHSPIDNGMLLRQVGAPGNQAIGMVEILIAAGRAVGSRSRRLLGSSGGAR